MGVSLTTPPRRADSSSHGQNPGHAASSALCQLSFYCLWYEYVIETLSQHWSGEVLQMASRNCYVLS